MDTKLALLEKLLMFVFVVAAILVSFLGGMLIMQNRKNAVIAVNVQQIDDYAKTLGQYSKDVELLEAQISELEAGLQFYDGQSQNYSMEKQELLVQINTLKSKVTDLNALMEKKQENKFPFQVPTTGIVASEHGFFNGILYGMDHLGVDIWTTTVNSGKLPNHKGNPVFSACNGLVGSYQVGNGGMTILCDAIPRDKGFNLPAYQVYTYYGHMGHAETKELYFQVQSGDRVKAGQLIGYQGDLSSFFPNMRNVHLHFSVFTGVSEGDPNGGAINPCLYVGGECQVRGYQFKI